MPAKLRNIIFITICIYALSVAFIYQGAKVAHVLPASFNNGTFSYLENANLQGRPALSFASIKNGTFQNKTEKWIATKVPKRDSVMLFNAKVQRDVIKTANLAWGFDTIPTFYGSKYSFNEKWNSVFHTSVQQSNEASKSYEESVIAINKFVEAHENLNFAIAIPDRIEQSDANPSYSLTSAPINDEYRHSHFLNRLDSRIKYVNLTYSDTSEYYKKYFRTDHHWNISEAAESYLKIMNSAFLDVKALEVNTLPFATYEKKEAQFFGAYSRQGLCVPEIGDQICDYVTDLSGVKITINENEVSADEIEDVDKYNNETYDKEKFTERYGEYFHLNYGLVTYEKDNHTGRNLLIFRDSYLNCSARFYAFSFDKVITIDQNKFDGNLEQITNENNITDVLFEQNDMRYYEKSSAENLIKILES